MQLSHPVLTRLRPTQFRQAMKSTLKVKLVVVLSASMLLNVFLLWEVKRKSDHAKNLENRINELRLGNN